MREKICHKGARAQSFISENKKNVPMEHFIGRKNKYFFDIVP